jgi:hypothetical protein
MVGYLWHKISEKEKKEIEENAKRIMLEFGKSLESIKEVKESVVERENFSRQELTPVPAEKGFKESILKNAPEKDKNSIIAEKGSWVK